MTEQITTKYRRVEGKKAFDIISVLRMSTSDLIENYNELKNVLKNLQNQASKKWLKEYLKNKRKKFLEEGNKEAADQIANKLVSEFDKVYAQHKKVLGSQIAHHKKLLKPLEEHIAEIKKVHAE